MNKYLLLFLAGSISGCAVDRNYVNKNVDHMKERFAEIDRAYSHPRTDQDRLDNLQLQVQLDQMDVGMAQTQCILAAP